MRLATALTLLVIGAVPAGADTIRLAQLDARNITTVINAGPGPDVITLRDAPVSILAPVSQTWPDLAVSWTTRGRTESALFDGLAGSDGVVWGFELQPWYTPAALTVTWGPVGTQPQTAQWMVQTAVPEPSAWVLVLTGIAAMIWTDRQRRR